MARTSGKCAEKLYRFKFAANVMYGAFAEDQRGDEHTLVQAFEQFKALVEHDNWGYRDLEIEVVCPGMQRFPIPRQAPLFRRLLNWPVAGSAERVVADNEASATLDSPDVAETVHAKAERFFSRLRGSLRNAKSQ